VARKLPYPLYKVLRIDHDETDEAGLVISALREDGTRVRFFVKNFKRYSFVKKSDYERLGIGRYIGNNDLPVVVEEEGFRFLLDGEEVYTLKTRKPVVLSKMKERFGADVIHQADVLYPTAFMVWIGLKRFFYLENAALLAMMGDDHGSEIDYRQIKPVADEDVPAERRFIFKHRVAYVDIEVLPKEGSVSFIDVEKAEEPVHVVSVVIRGEDKDVERVFLLTSDRRLVKHGTTMRHKFYDVDCEILFVANEREMLLALDKTLAEVTVVSFWNFKFDVPYLTKRAQKLGVRLDFLREAMIFDAMIAFSKYQRIDSYQKLKSVFDFLQKFRASEFEKLPPQFRTEIGKRYIDARRSQSGSSAITDVRSGKVAEYLFYSFSDVLDMWALDEVCGTDSFLGLIDAIGLADPLDVFMHSSTLDPVHLFFAMRHKVASPSKIRDRKEEVIRGAIVFEPKVGLHENVLVLDISHYYPSIILSKEVSPENVPGRENNPRMFDGQFFLVAFMERMLKLRYHYEALRDATDDPILKDRYAKEAWRVKTLTSGEWGYIASERNRYYAGHVKRIILEESRRGIQRIADFVKTQGVELIGGDTDSVFVQILGEATVERIRSLEQAINAMLDDYCREQGYTQKIKLKAEKLGGRMLITRKKRYAMMIVWKQGDAEIKPLEQGKLYVKGLDLVRGDTPLVAKHLQQRILDKILKEDVESALSFFVDYYHSIEKKARELRKNGKNKDTEFIESIAVPINFKAELESYKKGTSFHTYAKSASVWNERFPDEQIGARTKCFVVYFTDTYDQAYRGLDRVVFTNSALVDWSKFEIDVRKHFEIAVIRKVSLLFDSVGYDEDKLLSRIAGTVGAEDLF